MAEHAVIRSTADLTPDGPLGYVKAIWAGVAAGLAALGTALADGQVTGLEWVGIATAVLLAGGGAYGLANAVKPVAVVPLNTLPLTPDGPMGPVLPYEDDLGGPIGGRA